MVSTDRCSVGRAAARDFSERAAENKFYIIYRSVAPFQFDAVNEFSKSEFSAVGSRWSIS